MNKPVYLDLSILEIKNIVVYEYCYDYVKLNYGEKKLLLHGTSSFIVYIKTEDIYVDIAKDVKIRFDISNYPLLKGKHKKVIGVMIN